MNKRDWGINLIEFDASRIYAHASYYVEKVFAENRTDVNLATAYLSMDAMGMTPVEPVDGAGAFGAAGVFTVGKAREWWPGKHNP